MTLETEILPSLQILLAKCAIGSRARFIATEAIASIEAQAAKITRLETALEVFADIEHRKSWPCMDVWDYTNESDEKLETTRRVDFRWRHPDIEDPIKFARDVLEAK